MTIGSGFVPDPTLRIKLAKGAEFEAMMHEVAHKIAERAEDNAHQVGIHKPFMPRAGAEGWFVVAEMDAGMVAVVNTDHGGHLYEWGSIKTPAYAPLRRAVRAAGLTFRDETGQFAATPVSGGIDTGLLA